jgi:hypothetical protein
MKRVSHNEASRTHTYRCESTSAAGLVLSALTAEGVEQVDIQCVEGLIKPGVTIKHVEVRLKNMVVNGVLLNISPGVYSLGHGVEVDQCSFDGQVLAFQHIGEDVFNHSPIHAWTKASEAPPVRPAGPASVWHLAV